MLPAETDILCENCGYTLNGLQESGKCPECGEDIGISRSASGRKPPPWEEVTSGRSASNRWWITSRQIVLSPRQFFRTLNSRGNVAPAFAFARINWMAASLLLSLGLWIHSLFSWSYSEIHGSFRPIWLNPLILIGGPPVIYFLISFTQRLAARLTAWEAAYRGYRLPYPVVLRALYYHSAQWVPISLLGVLTTGTYALLVRLGFVNDDVSGAKYLVMLSAEVVVVAGYLFKNYWTAMRNLMYANN